MKARDNALRLRRHMVDEKTRKVEDLERMIREFEGMAVDLDRQIQAEEDRTGIRDRAHFSYSTFAKSAAQRRDNLRTSIDAMKDQLAEAMRERDSATETYARFRGPARRPGRTEVFPPPGRKDRRRRAALICCAWTA